MKPLPALTSCRFFAALWVVLAHFMHRQNVPPIVGQLVSKGYVGVSFFFVLSGFILGYNYTGRIDPPRFYRARFARLAPVYYLSLLISLPLLVRLGMDMVPGLIAAMTGFQSWWPSVAMGGNYPAWSVSTEIAFYLAFPWLLSRFSSSSNGIVLGWLALLAIVSILVTLLYSLFIYGGQADLRPADPRYLLNQAVITHPLIRLPEFAAGVGLSQLYLRTESARNTWLAFGFGLVSILIVLLLPTPIALVRSGLLLAPMCAIIWSLADKSNNVARLLSVKPLELLGQASYALYLLQVPVFAYVDAVWKRTAGGQSPLLVSLTVLVAVSILVHTRFEEPFRRRIAMKPRSIEALAAA